MDDFESPGVCSGFYLIMKRNSAKTGNHYAF